MIEFLFLDMDDTILDFQKAGDFAISGVLSELGIAPTPDAIALYTRINLQQWKRLERGELTLETVKQSGFALLFQTMGVSGDAERCARRHEQLLAQGHWLLPGAEAALEALSRRCRLFLASNGTAAVQRSRIAGAGISRYFSQIFISQELGANKPSREFFARCFARIPDFDPARAMIAGDSLTSDILGGKNAGIAACWVNTRHEQNLTAIQPDFEIEAISQLETLLATLA